jgi:hypothetical protein
MKKLKNKTVAISIAMILTLSMSASMILLPNSNAHTPPWEIPNYCYLQAAPNPVGVGQSVAVAMWTDTPLPNANAAPGSTNDIRRHGYTLTITAPDGTVSTQTWAVVSDTTGIQSTTFTPTQVGTYTLKFDYAGQVYTWSGDYQNDIQLPASKTIMVTVQQQPLPAAKSSYPLPAEYWTRPIEGQNTDWWNISSNWLGSPFTKGVIQPDGPAPNSPHVMWTKPIQFGGVVGAGASNSVPGNTFYMGGSYNVRFSGALIIYGILYYQEPFGNSGGGGNYVAVDLRTGHEEWRINATATGVSLYPSFGYLYNSENPNQHGILPNGLLVATQTVTGLGTVWRGYDPRTGVLTPTNVTNIPGGTNVAGPQGEELKLALTNYGNTTNPNWYLSEWNSSKVFGIYSGYGTAAWYSGTQNASASTAYDWNQSVKLGTGTWSISQVDYDNIMLLTQGSFGSPGNWQGANVTAMSLKTGSIGQVLWTKNYPAAPGNMTRSLSSWDPKAGVFVFEDKETMNLFGFSLADGSQLWGPKKPIPEASDWAFFRQATSAAYGKLYFGGYSGILYCYDIKTGDLLWTYGNGGEGNTTSTGLGAPWNRWPIFIDVIADGKVYLATTEHSPSSPYYKDSQFRCIDAYNGTELWSIMGWGTGMDATGYDRVADGYFAYLNCYDMQIYSVGKGPSALTVTAPLADIALGSGLVIRGTVTDISAGTKQDEQAARFPQGVPAVSDASMSAWMEYIYMQKPKPTNATGVPVSIDVIDANGNYRNIGTTTSDTSGMFSFQWTPDITGKYTVIATFAGSNSYWPSTAETSFAVDPVAPTAAPQPEISLPPTEMYIGAATAAIIIAIAIVGVVMVLMLRKRP